MTALMSYMHIFEFPSTSADINHAERYDNARDCPKVMAQKPLAAEVLLEVGYFFAFRLLRGDAAGFRI
jgi:hypothetical protein